MNLPRDLCESLVDCLFRTDEHGSVSPLPPSNTKTNNLSHLWFNYKPCYLLCNRSWMQNYSQRMRWWRGDCRNSDIPPGFKRRCVRNTKTNALVVTRETLDRCFSVFLIGAAAALSRIFRDTDKWVFTVLIAWLWRDTVYPQQSHCFEAVLCPDRVNWPGGTVGYMSVSAVLVKVCLRSHLEVVSISTKRALAN